ncbi:hypothetical protein BT96DRAFT_752598, partial [Gymnopus androsaceus JB14]
WLEKHRTDYLDELIRLDGRGDVASITDCPDCMARGRLLTGRAEIRCIDCVSPYLVCASCCTEQHGRDPFHRVEVRFIRWNGDFFTKTSLAKLSLTVQLNHTTTQCSNPLRCHQNFLVMDTTGPHRLSLYFCGCERAELHDIQLLRFRLYPAT